MRLSHQPGLFDGTGQPPCASVLPDKAAQVDQVGDVGHRFPFAELVALQLIRPKQGLVVALCVGGGAVRHRLDLLWVQ